MNNMLSIALSLGIRVGGCSFLVGLVVLALWLMGLAGSFGIRVLLFVSGCSLLVLFLGLAARWWIFKDARKDDEKAPSDATPPQPSSGPAVAT